MSSQTQISFGAVIRVGQQSVPLLSEVVFGDSSSQDGVEKGFLFKLDRQSGQSPVTIYLGDMIRFIEESLGGGTGCLATSDSMASLSPCFQQPDATIDSTNFTHDNQMKVDIYEFTINSTTSQFLFSITIDIGMADPNKGLIALPGELNEWLKISSLGISFRATSKTATTVAV
jgi:hypothetical protein